MAHHNIRAANVTLGLGPVDNTTVPGCPMPPLGLESWLSVLAVLAGDGVIVGVVIVVDVVSGFRHFFPIVLNGWLAG